MSARKGGRARGDADRARGGASPERRDGAGADPPRGGDGARTLRTAVMPALMALVGIAIIVRTLAAGGGPVATGILLGVLFTAAGVMRLYAERHRR
jgi:hypothetical protein